MKGELPLPDETLPFRKVLIGLHKVVYTYMPTDFKDIPCCLLSMAPIAGKLMGGAIMVDFLIRHLLLMYHKNTGIFLLRWCLR